MRIVISSILAILLIFGAIMIARNLIDTDKEAEQVSNKIVTPVSVIKIENSTIPVSIFSNGHLVPKNRLEVFAEVSGIFEQSSHTFKPGSYFQKQDTLLKINSDEHAANLKSLKSSLFNQIVLFLPDLKLDYPESYPAWAKYVAEFELKNKIAPLPEPVSEKEKLFIIGRGIFSTYYNISNLEERSAKYIILAPFSGILTEAYVQPGTLVRNGQKLAELVSSSSFEMEVSLNISMLDLVKIGQKVSLQNLDGSKSWVGKVIRIDGRVDQASQTIKVFISLSGKGLREGMFLEAQIDIQSFENAAEIDRNLLINNNSIFSVRDTILNTLDVNPVFYDKETVIVQNIPDGTKILARSIPGAFEGMRVKVLEF